MLNPDVTRHLAGLEHPLKPVIEDIRRAMLDGDPLVDEIVKWNAPNFRYAGQDRLTLNIRPGKGVTLVFHRGAKTKDTTAFTFDDPTGLMKWPAKDRAIVDIITLQDWASMRTQILDLIRRWMSATKE